MDKSKIGLGGAMAIGIGGMVGGGIFAVLGLAVSLGKGGTPFSFLIAGIIALVTSYSYVKLSLSYPDRGGTVKFINQVLEKVYLAGASTICYGLVILSCLRCMPLLLGRMLPTYMK